MTPLSFIAWGVAVGLGVGTGLMLAFCIPFFIGTNMVKRLFPDPEAETCSSEEEDVPATEPSPSRTDG